MMRAALKMLLQNKGRFVFSAFGRAALFLLSAAQVGLLVGWCNPSRPSWPIVFGARNARARAKAGKRGWHGDALER